MKFLGAKKCVFIYFLISKWFDWNLCLCFNIFLGHWHFRTSDYFSVWRSEYRSKCWIAVAKSRIPLPSSVCSGTGTPRRPTTSPRGWPRAPLDPPTAMMRAPVSCKWRCVTDHGNHFHSLSKVMVAAVVFQGTESLVQDRVFVARCIVPRQPTGQLGALDHPGTVNRHLRGPDLRHRTPTFARVQFCSGWRSVLKLTFSWKYRIIHLRNLFYNSNITS